MQNALAKTETFLRTNIDTKMVVSGAVAGLALSLALWAMHKSNVKILQGVAKAAAGKS